MVLIVCCFFKIIGTTSTLFMLIFASSIVTYQLRLCSIERFTFSAKKSMRRLLCLQCIQKGIL